jgi:surfeit locus 1 family protein
MAAMPGSEIVEMKSRRFRPAVAPGVAALLAFALAVSLGNWQTRRAAEKLALAEALQQGSQRAVLALPARPVDARDYEFSRVSARGEYSAKHTILLDNKVLRGVVGYQVLTPLKISGGDLHVLVNRGWVAAGSRRDSLPQIQTPAGMQFVEGIALVPGSRIFELGATTEDGMVWQNLVLARYEKWSGLKLQPVVLQESGDAADGLKRVWERPDTGVNTHRGYAFQWYSLAVLIVVLYVVLSFKRPA